MNSQSDTDIERKLRHAGEQLKGETDMVQSVMAQIERVAPPRAENLILRPWVKALTAIAAIVAVGFGVWFFSISTTPLAFAQVLKAMEDVKTARAEIVTSVSGRSMVCVYERGVGFRLDGTMTGLKYLLIDNGTREWTRMGDGELKESESSGSIEQFKKVLLAEKVLEGAKRDKSGDEVIEGTKCRLFAKEPKADSFGSRVWVDEQERVRKMETVELYDGKPKSTQTAMVHYDIPIDRALFNPPIVATSKPANMDARVEQLFSLDQPLAKTEVLGLIVAVHEVRASADGMLLVRTSLRPNAETLKKFGAGFGWNALANYQLQIDGYQPLPMGSYHKQRMIGQWDFFMPIKPIAAPPQKIAIRAIGVWTEEELEASLRADGKKTYINDIAIGNVAFPQQTQSIDELLSSCWDQASSVYSLLTPVFFREMAMTANGKHVYHTKPLDQWKLEKLKSEFDVQTKALRNLHEVWQGSRNVTKQ